MHIIENEVLFISVLVGKDSQDADSPKAGLEDYISSTGLPKVGMSGMQ
jgi:hypothetical protein